MDLFSIELETKRLMAAYGLNDQGWVFKWDNAARKFGQCIYSSKTITMSRMLASKRTPANIRNTVLHEIAHALVGPGHGHGPVWRAKAISIGCDGERCGTDQIEPDYKWIAKCPNNHIHKRYIRRPNRKVRRSCGKCSPVFDSKFIISVVAI